MGRYVTTAGTSGSGAVTKTVTSAYSAVVNDRILADSTSSAFTITLPLGATLLTGDTIQVFDIAGQASVNNITINPQDQKIQNVSGNMTMDLNNVALTLTYTGSTYGWAIVSS
jgi:hypothetical protein